MHQRREPVERCAGAHRRLEPRRGRMGGIRVQIGARALEGMRQPADRRRIGARERLGEAVRGRARGFDEHPDDLAHEVAIAVDAGQQLRPVGRIAGRGLAVPAGGRRPPRRRLGAEVAPERVLELDPIERLGEVVVHAGGRQCLGTVHRIAVMRRSVCVRRSPASSRGSAGSPDSRRVTGIWQSIRISSKPPVAPLVDAPAPVAHDVDLHSPRLSSTPRTIFWLTRLSSASSTCAPPSSNAARERSATTIGWRAAPAPRLHREHLDQRLAQLAVRHRLEQIGGESQAREVRGAAHALRRGEQHQAHRAEAAVRDDAPAEMEAVAAGHHVVEDRDVERRPGVHARLQRRERRVGAVHALRDHAELRELAAQHPAIGRVIVDDQRAAVLQGDSRGHGGLGAGARGAEARGEPEDRALTLRAVGADLALHELDQSSHTEPQVINVLNYTLIPDLEDFPVLIDIVDSDLASKAQVDGDDILFTDQHKNKLDHEIELYNSTSGHLVAWVKLPHLFMNQEEDVYMFYGNQNAANQQNVSGVWNTHYMVVHHLEETSGALSDSTKHHNDGVPQNGVALNIAGKIDGADAFDGTDDFISIPHNSTLDGNGTWSEMTMETWIKADTSQNARIILAKWGAASSRSYELGIDSAGNTQLFAGIDNGAYLETLYSDVTSLTPGTWYYVTFTYKAGVLNLYINGILDANRSNTGGNIKASLDSLKIGARNPTPERFFDGSIDEVRISNVARNSNWTLLTYRNQNDTSMFISVGPEEGQNIILSGEYPVNGATDIPLSPILEISVNHTKGYLMNITWETNATGGWTVIGTNTYTGNNTYHCANTHSMNNNNKTYYWSVEVNDGHGSWMNKTYSFTTEVAFVNSAPIVSTPYPENGRYRCYETACLLPYCNQ